MYNVTCKSVFSSLIKRCRVNNTSKRMVSLSVVELPAVIKVNCYRFSLGHWTINSSIQPLELSCFNQFTTELSIPILPFQKREKNFKYSTVNLIIYRQKSRKMSENTKPQAKYFPVKKNPMLPAGTFTGRTALITGGGTGLGKAMALMLGTLGASVAILGR